ncbi:MAG: PDZ domain-containing protein [Limisphaerales bacterium]
MTRRPPALLLLLVLVLGTRPASRAADLASWGASLVTVEVTFKDYDLFQPWTRPTRSIRKHGLVVGEKEILTTAQHLPNQTLVRLQKNGRGRWHNATVKWLDPHTDLAVLTTEEASFWDGLRPAALADRVPRASEFTLLRWRDGNLEGRRVEFSKFTVGEGVLSFAPRMILEVNTDISGLGWAEAVTIDGQIIGLTSAKGGNTCNVIPAGFIRRVLEAQRAGGFTGLGYFDFVWQPTQNPATFDFLRLPGAPRGGVVIETASRPGAQRVLQSRDVLLEIDGFAVDSEGDYDDPDYGHLNAENLATRSRFAGEAVKLKILRDGQEQETEYRLPRAEFTNELVPREAFGRDPEFLIAAGLVFQPLNQPFLRGWGDEWARRAPFRLTYFQNDQPTAGRPALVLLSNVLPDTANLGYQTARFLVVDKINGRTIGTLDDVAAALKEPRDGVHRVEFKPGESLQRLLLDAATLDAATARVLQRFSIPAARSAPPAG